MIFKNILVPYDDSKCAIHAVKLATNIAKKYKSKLIVATCIPTTYYTGNWYTDHRYIEAISKKQKEDAVNFLKKINEIGKKQNIPLEIKMFESDSIVKGIVDFAKKNKTDLIVMGTRGKTGWNKLLLGSVATGVSQNVHCPVLLVR